MISPRGKGIAVLLVLAVLFPAFALADITPEQRAAIAQLAEKYQKWLAEVDVLMTDGERDAFLALTKDYQRDAFIQRFWDQRDPIPRTARNEARQRFEDNVRVARERFGDFQDAADARVRILLLNGPPASILESDCPLILWPLEAWYYPGSERVREAFVLVLYRKWGAGPWRLWNAAEGVDALFAQGVLDEAPSKQAMALTGLPTRSIERVAECGDGDKGRKLLAALRWVGSQGLAWEFLQARIESKPEGPGGEWVSTFASYSTDVAEGTAPLPATLEIAFPGRSGNRTVVQGLLAVPAAEAGLSQAGEQRSYNLLLNGEVVREGELFDSFRYKFDLPSAEGSSTIPLAFQRPLRPGAYTLVVRVEDVNSGKAARIERALEVPAADRPVPAAPRTQEEIESARLFAEADAALASGETGVRILPPHGEMQTGMQRFDAQVTGADIAKVTFSLDGRALLTKNAPPYSVELDLGSVPRTRTLEAVAYDAAGEPVASDELQVNTAGRSFRVRLTEPRRNKRYAASLLARAEATAPEGQAIERVELYLNETRVATLYQPPYEHPVLLPRDEPLSYVRAVAYLPDGNSAEHLVFINAPDIGEFNVDFVELYTSVTDRKGRPVADLTAKDFTVLEDGVHQEIARFERVTDLPIHAALALDVSASMETSLEEARAAALRFFQGSVHAKDRAALVTFNDHPTLAVKFTSDVNALAGGLAGLKAERGTALYDTVVFTLYCFNGLKGQRAIVLLSDGKDEGSRFGFEEVLEYARRAGVTIYPIGLGSGVEKKKLSAFAEETGGRAFFPRSAEELPALYAAIEEELRSKVLIAYQSTNTSGSPAFRFVELKTGRPGVEAKTLRGYYP